MGDHREHDTEIFVPFLPETFEGLHLETELFRALEVAPDPPPAEHGVVLVGFVLPAHHVPEFVGRGIEGPHPHRFTGKCIEYNLDPIVEFLDKILLSVVGDEPAGGLVKPEDQVLDPKQAYAIGTGRSSPAGRLRNGDIHLH